MEELKTERNKKRKKIEKKIKSRIKYPGERKQKDI